MRVTGIRWVSAPAGWRTLRAGAAALAVVGVLGAVPSAARAGAVASVPGWAKQHPAVHPSARYGAAMAYDAATGTAVLFGGRGIDGLADSTWTWDGSTWTQQAPAASPPALAGAAMAYDAATGDVVLFGGEGRHGYPAGTWTWNGTTWTRQVPAASPPGLTGGAMAYDAATGDVVLFGGLTNSGTALDETWTWDGSTWTQQAPAASPPGREDAAMAYDAATGTVVLFGGQNDSGLSYLSDTWTWNGTTWTPQAPAASPPALYGAAMTYDAATGTAVLFGGFSLSRSCRSTNGFCRDTWAWDGSTWTRQASAARPHARQGAAMAYDAATGTVVLSGGMATVTGRGIEFFDDTWTWA
jgi:hypothetical protein